MPSVNAFEINGVIDTNQNVLSNIHSLCEASGCWLSYDVTTGLWSVVINSTGSSAKSFDDSNIIGAINVTGTGINEAYNKVSVEFPHKDLRDQTDYVDLEIPEANRFPNELDNTLSINLKLTNDPVQAQYIGTVQLKQSRVDRIVEFRTDYTSFGLRAGDLIDITSTMYGFTSKVFRITKLVEEDADDGSLNIAITALEYDADVYNTGGLVRSERLKKTGITPKSNNSILTASDNAYAIKSSNSLLYEFQTPTNGIVITSWTGNTQTFMAGFPSNVSHADCYSTGYSFTLPYTGQYKLVYFINFGSPTFSYDGAGEPLLSATSQKRVRINITKNGTHVTLDDSLTSHIIGSDPFLDITTTDSFSGTKGDVIVFYLDARGKISLGTIGVAITGSLYFFG